MKSRQIIDCEPDAVEKRIISALDNVSKDAGSENWPGDRIWTAQIKKRLRDIASDLGYACCPSDALGCELQFLFDLIWVEEAINAQGRKRFVGMPLALECEWKINPDDIFYDFEKLLVARTEHRVMIFQVSKDGAQSPIFDSLKDRVSNFKSSSEGDRFFLAAWVPQPTNSFQYVSFQVGQPSATGTSE